MGAFNQNTPQGRESVSSRTVGRHHQQTKATVLASFIILGLSTAEACTLLLDNLREETTSEARVGVLFIENQVDVHYVQANAFTTGSNGRGYILDSVSIRWNSVIGNPTDLAVAIFTDASGQPGAQLERLQGPAPTPQNTPISLDYNSSGLVLSPNTTYHLWVDAANNPNPPNTQNDRFNISATDSSDEMSPDGWRMANIGFQSTDNGISWSARGVRSQDRVLQFGIRGTPVPEPRTYWAGGGAVLIIFLVSRHHYRRRQT